MRIDREVIALGFSGPQGSGKTTLARLVAERLGLPFVGSYARKYLERERVKYEDLAKDPLTLCDFQLQCFDFAASLRPPFVTDRTVYDMMAYSILDLKKVIERTRFYSKVFFLPFHEKFLKNDGVRCIDPRHAKSMHFLILSLLEYYEVNYYIVQSVRLNDRVEEVCYELRY